MIALLHSPGYLNHDFNQKLSDQHKLLNLWHKLFHNLLFSKIFFLLFAPNLIGGSINVTRKNRFIAPEIGNISSILKNTFFYISATNFQITINFPISQMI